MDWNDFIDVAKRVAKEEGYPIAVLLGQAALETGRSLSKAPGYNFFGIKGQGNAGTQALNTWEDYGQGRVDIVDKFAKFKSPEDAVRAYINLIKENYPKAWALRNDPIAMVQAIKQGGYATDPQYVQKVTSTPEFKQNQREVLGTASDPLAKYVTPTPQQAQDLRLKQPNILDMLWSTIFPKADASYNPTTLLSTRNYSYQPQSSSTNYTVQPGDTLWGIAQQYGLGGNNWGQIKGYSGSPTQLPIGQNLQIPRPMSYTRPVVAQNSQKSTPANANYSSPSGPAYSPPPATQSYSPRPSQPTSQPSAQLNFSPSKPVQQYTGKSPFNVKTKSGLSLTI